MRKTATAISFRLLNSGQVQWRRTSAMEVKLYESDRRVNAVIVWIIVSKPADPSKVGLVEMGLKVMNSVL